MNKIDRFLALSPQTYFELIVIQLNPVFFVQTKGLFTQK